MFPEGDGAGKTILDQEPGGDCNDFRQFIFPGPFTPRQTNMNLGSFICLRSNDHPRFRCRCFKGYGLNEHINVLSIRIQIV